MPVGIDVAKATFVIAFHDTRVRRWRTRTLARTSAGVEAACAWLARYGQQQAPIGLEATGAYHEFVAEAFHAHGFRVSVINPARIKAHGHSRMQRGKTDPMDARLIADFLEVHTPPAWEPPPAAVRKLRAYHQRLRALKHTRRQERNRLETSSPLVHESIHALLAHIEAQIARLQRQLDALIARSEALANARRLLCSIHGVSDGLSQELLARLPELQRARSARALVAFVGLDPAPYQSGTSVHPPRRISRRGDAQLRAAFYMPSLSAMQHNPVLRAFAQRLRARGVTGKALVCAVSRKLIHLIHGVLKSGRPFDPTLHLLH